jgi:hypothetical protein
MDYLYLYLPMLESLSLKDWEEVEAEIPSFDSTSQVQLTPEITVYQWLQPPILPYQLYHYREIKKGLEVYVEDRKYLFMISRGGRMDAEVREFLGSL